MRDKRKLLTIHNNVKLCPELVEVLAHIAQGFDSPTWRSTSDGIVVEIDQWDRRST